jgi:hypothetical protein
MTAISWVALALILSAHDEIVLERGSLTWVKKTSTGGGGFVGFLEVSRWVKKMLIGFLGCLRFSNIRIRTVSSAH